MIKNRSKMPRALTIDLSGPEGNAFCILGYAKDLCRQLGRDYAPIQKEMTSGDYENLIAVFDREFGSFVTIYKANDDEEDEDDDFNDAEDEFECEHCFEMYPLANKVVKKGKAYCSDCSTMDSLKD